MKREVSGIVFLGMVIASADGLTADVHVHGAAELHVVIENSNVEIELHSPLENLAGFEHQPRTAAERAKIAKMKANLNQPEKLFKFPALGNCGPGSVRIDSPIAEAAAAKSSASESRHDANDDDGHSDLVARYVFTCGRIDKVDAIDVKLFEAFPGLKSVKAIVIGPNGQSAKTLTAGRRSLIIRGK
ncbi:MAG: DUF2796 domain-containing protein [Burkholderiales bacterium]